MQRAVSHHRLQMLKAGVAYFALVFAAGFVFGSIRVLYLLLCLGERIAELAEMPLMLLVIILAARFIVTQFNLPNKTAILLGTGMIALSLLCMAEGFMVLVVNAQSLREYVLSRDPISGGVYLILLIIFALMPFIVLQIRLKTKQH